MNHQTKHMLQAAQKAIIHAYAPYSNFSVAACIMTTTGNYYTGVNVENCSYGLTLCAEASAIAQMVSAGQRTIQSMLIICDNKKLCAPCGACRQRIHEFSTEDTTIHLCKDDTISQTLSISELLPLAFSRIF